MSTYTHARACTETGNGINHLLQPINHTFRYPKPMRHDAFPSISSKSHLIRAICACRAARDYADRKLHRSVPRIRSRRKGCGSESYRTSFSHRFSSARIVISVRGAPLWMCLVPTPTTWREPLLHILDGTRQIFPTMLHRNSVCIVLYGDTSYGRTGEFCSQNTTFFPSTTSFLGKQRMVVSKGDQQTLGVYFLEHAIEAI